VGFDLALLGAVAAPAPIVPIREVELRADGKVKRAKLMIEHADPDEVYTGPRPSVVKYHGGAFRYKPVREVEQAWDESVKIYGTHGYEAVCLTCQESLYISQFVLESGEVVQTTAAEVFGAASDHVRTTMNHAVIVRRADDRTELYESPYDILKTCSWEGR
jgi:hypothetical protein